MDTPFLFQGLSNLPVLLDVDEPDQFAARIRQEWSIQ